MKAKRNSLVPFLYRAFHGAGFRLSLGLGAALAVLQVVQTASPVDGGFSYPTSLYEMWVGGEWASYAGALLFLLLPLLATLPFAAALAQDRKSGYLLQLLVRQARRPVFCEYASAAFLSGFDASTAPFLENLLLNAALYPALAPQASTFTFSPSLRGFAVGFFYSRPLLYCLLFIVIIGVFGGALACLGTALSFLVSSPVLVHLLVFGGYFWVYYLTMQLGLYGLNPYIFLNPSQAMVFTLPVYLAYVLGMLAAAAAVLAVKGKTYECLA